MNRVVRFNFEQHGAIYGKSSSGKSFLAKHLFKQTRVRAIYWNRQEEHIPGVPERHTWDIRALQKPGAKMNLVPPSSEEASCQLLTRIQEDLFRVCKKIVKPGDRRPVVVFLHDEPDKEAPATDKESGAYEMAVRGNRHGVKYWAMTQAPSQLSKSARKQAATKILFAVDEEEEHFLRRARVPDDVFDWIQWTQEDGEAKPSFRFAVNQGAGWVKCDPYKVA